MLKKHKLWLQFIIHFYRQNATRSVWEDFPMAVCGPLNHGNNCTQYVSTELLNKFIECCMKSTELLTD